MNEKKTAKTYAGIMTSPVKFLRQINRNAIHFRSTNPIGANVSYLYVKGTKRGVYCMCSAADTFNHIVRTHPGMTLYQLQNYIGDRDRAEIIEIFQIYIGYGFGDLVPQLVIDGDKA